MGDQDGRYFISKRSGWLYGSPRFPGGARILDEIVETATEPRFAKVGEELVIREPPAGRFQIKATIWEDDRRIQTLTIQKWRVKDGYPHDREHFSFVGQEVPRLLEFVQRLRDLHLNGARAFKTAIDDLCPVLMTPAQEKRFLAEREDLVIKAATHEVTQQDIVALAYRKKQLAHFERLLSDAAFFEAERRRLDKAPEPLWQAFFEANPWILGHGLSYVFMSGLDGRKLEQTVKGTDLAGPGKVTDGIMKTNARMNAVAFVEVKRHDTPLLRKVTYRSGVWGPSDELSGGVAQCHETVRLATEWMHGRYRPNHPESGAPTGEDLFAVNPKSFLVVGSLSEFEGEHGPHEGRYRSFESFRRNLHRPEVITFDELLYRARYIVDAQAAAATEPEEVSDDFEF